MSALQRVGAAILSRALAVYAVLALVYLLLPIFMVAMFSFNDPIGRSNYSWSSFTLDNWLTLFRDPSLVKAVGTSLRIALISTVVATSIGTLMAMALVRYAFRFRRAVDLFVFLPLATPEIVLGASLLTLFVAIGRPPFFPLNGFTILIAHISFNISYVIVTVRARISGFDRRLEEAAADLGADSFSTFRYITLPGMRTALLSGGLLAFALAFDDQDGIKAIQTDAKKGGYRIKDIVRAVALSDLMKKR